MTNRNYVKPKEKYSTYAPIGKKKERLNVFTIKRGILPEKRLHGKPFTDIYLGILNKSWFLSTLSPQSMQLIEGYKT